MGDAMLVKRSKSGSTALEGTEATFIAKNKLEINDVVYTIQGNIGEEPEFADIGDEIHACAFSPDGARFILGGLLTGYAKIYSVSGTRLFFMSDIYADTETTALDDDVLACAFSPDSTKFVLGGDFTGLAKIYSVSGTTVTFVSNIYADTGTTALDSTVYALAFSPDGTELVLGGFFTGKAKIYSVSGTTVTFVSDIYADAGTTALDSSIRALSFSPDGTELVLIGAFTGRAKIYSVSGTAVTFVSDIYADTGTTALSSYGYSLAFSLDGTKLVLGGLFTGKAKIYSVSGTAVTFVSDIYADTGTTELSSSVRAIAFSPDGTKLLLGGFFIGGAKIYSVSGTTVTFESNLTDPNVAVHSIHACVFPSESNLIIAGELYGHAKIYSVSGTIATFVSNIHASIESVSLEFTEAACAFSPDGTKLVLGGNRPGLYSVSGTAVTFIADLYADTAAMTLSSTALAIAFSPDGTKLVLGGYFTGKAKIYSVSGNTVTFISDLYANTETTSLDDYVYACAFSPDGTELVLGGAFTGRAKIYSVSGTTVTFVSDIYADTGTTVISSSVYALAFSLYGTKLVLGGAFTGKAKIYSVSGTTVTFVSNIYADTGTTALNGTVYALAFSPDGTELVLGGAFTDRAKIYSVSGTTVTFVSGIYADSGTTEIDDYVRAIAFSPDGTELVLGGEFSDGAKIYSVSGTTVTFVSDIYADSVATAIDNYVHAIAFSPDGTKLILGGEFLGRAKIYSISGTTVTFVYNVHPIPMTALDPYVSSIAFSPDGTKLVLGGGFLGYAKIYSVSGTTITFVSNIYADTGTTALDGTVYALAFSPDGTELVLGGAFTGRAKIYSVSGTTVTFVSDIYADTGTTALSGSARACAFSPDGPELVLVGYFTGRAKIYSVSGTTVTFVSDIYADTGTTALSGSALVIAFSLDGTKLVLGGAFTGMAKIYSVSGTTVTFVSDIYADTGTTALSSYVYACAFSPDGTKLVIGGVFTGYAKMYSVSGTTVTFVSDLHADLVATAIDKFVYACAFSPDGTELVLGGGFLGYAKIYSVSDTGVPFVSNIYANTGTTALDCYVRAIAFSPNGTELVLCGHFTGKAKIYSVSGTIVKFVNEAYKLVENAITRMLALASVGIGYALEPAEISDDVSIKIIALE